MILTMSAVSVVARRSPPCPRWPGGAACPAPGTRRARACRPRTASRPARRSRARRRYWAFPGPRAAPTVTRQPGGGATVTRAGDGGERRRRRGTGRRRSRSACVSSRCAERTVRSLRVDAIARDDARGRRARRRARSTCRPCAPPAAGRPPRCTPGPAGGARTRAPGTSRASTPAASGRRQPPPMGKRASTRTRCAWRSSRSIRYSTHAIVR